MDEQGQSFSTVSVGAVCALLLMAGLVVDGGAQLAAHRRAESVAARAARGGTDAMAAYVVAGRSGDTVATSTALGIVRSEGLTGSAHMNGPTLTVEVRASAPTTFLSLIGMTELSATGRAHAQLRHS